jgi:hypothetical protein
MVQTAMAMLSAPRSLPVPGDREQDGQAVDEQQYSAEWQDFASMPMLEIRSLFLPLS